MRPLLWAPARRGSKSQKLDYPQAILTTGLLVRVKSDLATVFAHAMIICSEVLNDNCGHYTFKVPSDIAPGQYLLRAEVIALHVASSVGGAQFYMSCYQITIGGSGSAAPPTVSIPGTYNANDPGILINIYTQLNSYASRSS